MEGNSSNKRLFLIIGVMCLFLLGGLYVLFGMKSSSKPPEDEKQTAVPTSYPQNTPTEDLKRNITSIDDLHDIIVAIIDYAETKGNTDPDIDIISNDGEYATASLRQVDVAGGAMVFVVKRNNAWSVIYEGNGMPLCEEIASVKTKYALPPNFPKCVEGL